MPDNDGEMLKQLGYALGDLQNKYRSLNPLDRAKLRPKLDEAFKNYQDFRLILLGGATITTEEDLADIRAIRNEIDAAASKQSLLVAIGRIAGFIIPRIV